MAALHIVYLILGIFGSFFIGSIPFSVILGRLATGKDLRNFNIGNPGGFNAVMTYGYKIGLPIMFIDIFKGFVPIVILDYIFRMSYFTTDNVIWYRLAVILGPLFCIFGHNHSPFLKFQGGRGTAVFIGVLLWVNPLIFTIAYIPFVLMIGLLKIPTRVSSVIGGIFFIPASIFIPIAPPWTQLILNDWILPPGLEYLYLTPFLISLGMWVGWLPRLIPSVIAAFKGKEWTLKINEGQQFSDKFQTKKESAIEEMKKEDEKKEK